jgi:hypothetical protein
MKAEALLRRSLGAAQQDGTVTAPPSEDEKALSFQKVSEKVRLLQRYHKLNPQADTVDVFVCRVPVAPLLPSSSSYSSSALETALDCDKRSRTPTSRSPPSRPFGRSPPPKSSNLKLDREEGERAASGSRLCHNRLGYFLVP